MWNAYSLHIIPTQLLNSHSYRSYILINDFVLRTKTRVIERSFLNLLKIYSKHNKKIAKCQ